MQCAVEKFVKERQNGLCLIDMPTGSGKTYLTRQIIEKYLKKEILTDVKTIIYLTPQKKNIDDIYNKLKESFSDDLSLFDSNVLRIYANYECVIDKFLAVYKDLPQQIRDKKSCKELYDNVKLYKKLESNGDIPEDILKSNLMEIRKNYEVAFRKDLAEELAKEARTVPQRKAKLNGSYKWVKELYPSCLTEDRKVLFMTMDKFLYGNDPIISKPYRFISHHKTKGALIFIDEFDATKDVILNQEIQNCTDYKIDLIKLFSSICNTLKGREFPISIFAEDLDENDKNSSVSRFNYMKNYIIETEKKYNLNFLFKLETQDESERYFLFDDYQLHTITNSKTENHIILKDDHKKRQNTISISEKGDDGKFYRTIYAIKNAINIFIGCCGQMAQKYMNRYNDKAKEKHQDMMEIEQAVSTIIDPYNLDYAVAKNLINMIVDNVSIPILERGKDIFDTDFYMNGFRYYDFKDDISHDVSTAMAMCYLENTPEKFMLSLSSKARVVGLSATASIKTVTGNYSIEYLEDRLNENFYKLPNYDLQRIREYVIDRLGKKTNINIEPKGIDAQENDELKSLILQVFSSEKHTEKFTGLFSKHIQSAERDKYFHIKRFLKCLSAIKSFLANNSSRVLLTMTNRNVAENGSNIFSRDNIEESVEALCEELQTEVPKCHYLRSSGFAEQKIYYKSDIQNGYKIVLFSSYTTAGTGQNLQYEEEDKEKDIDSIYLEYPRNSLVKLSDAKEESNLIKLVYQYEALKTNGEISPYISLNNIKVAFKQIMQSKGKDRFENVAYKSVSVNNHILKTLIQAVGRICRVKSEGDSLDKNIYVDSEIFDSIDFSYLQKEKRLLNPEFERIVKYGEKQTNNEELHINLNKACDRNHRVKTRIDNILNSNRQSWSDRDVEQWLKIREFVLKHPTISKQDLANAVKECYSYKDFYLEARESEKISSYRFIKGQNDGDVDKILYNYSNNKEGYLVNANNARLNTLVKIPAVRNIFSENGYAFDFEKNDAIILPIVYQNIYKGALGEVAGRAILESHGIKLSEIIDNSKFEKFDFCLTENPNIYIDFKNWSETDKVNKKEYKEKCLDKLNKINGEKVFIINAAAERFNIHNDGKIIEVSSLCRPQGECLYELANKDMNKIIALLLEAQNGNQ